MISFGFGCLAGCLVLGILLWVKAPTLMITESSSSYGFEQSVEILKRTAEDLNWKIPAVHAIDETLAKAGYEVKKATILELCRPDYAYPLLKNDATRHITSLMPCRIAIYEKDSGKVIISRMNTGLLSKMFGRAINRVMAKASGDSETIIQSVLRNGRDKGQAH